MGPKLLSNQVEKRKVGQARPTKGNTQRYTGGHETKREKFGNPSRNGKREKETGELPEQGRKRPLSKVTKQDLGDTKGNKYVLPVHVIVY